jgi:lipoprotein-releasing system permease protein
MPNSTSLSRKIAKRLGAKSSAASWSRPVVRIATVGVAIGMALIVVATSIVHGFQQEVKELVVGFGSDIQVLNADYDNQKIIRQPATEAELSELEGVRAVHPFYTLPGIIESQSGVKGVVAKGLNEETTQAFLERFMVDGDLDLGADGAVLSVHQAQRLELEAGDRFTVYLVGGPNGVRPRNFKLTGTYRTGLLEYDQEFMFLPAAWVQEAAGWGLEMQVLAEGESVELRSYGSRTAPVYQWHRRSESGSWEPTRDVVGATASIVPEAGAEFMVTAVGRDANERLVPDSIRLYAADSTWAWERLGGSWAAAASGLEVYVEPGAALWDVEARVYDALPIGWRTETVLQQAPEMFTWLGMLDLNVEIIIGLMVLISVINMTSALLILILERRPMVGMLKALGMPDAQVMRVFFWQAVRIIGRGFVWGNVVGLALVALQSSTGWVALNPEAYYLDVVPVRVDAVYLVGVELLAFGACALMMGLPSLASVRIRPAEALRINR